VAARPADTTCANRDDGEPCYVAPPVAPGKFASCTAIEVGSTPARAVSSPPTFSATDILDVTFTVRFAERGSIPASVSMKFFTPEGHLYQETTFPVSQGVVPVDIAVARRSASVKAPVVAVPSRTSRSVTAPPLPVNGTLISQNSLYGTWKVTATLPGNPKSCMAQFVVTP
jgi:hypothetical protein